MPRLQQPSFKQKTLIKEYLRTGSLKKAGELAYPGTKYPHKTAWSTMNKSKSVREYMRTLLDLQGLTDEDISAGLKKIKDAGTTPEALAQATPRDAMAAIKFAAELKDLMPAKKIESKTATMNINLEGKTETELNDTLNNLTKEIREFQEMVKKTKAIKAEEKPGGWL